MRGTGIVNHEGIEIVSLTGLSVGGVRVQSVDMAARELERQMTGKMGRAMVAIHADLNATMNKITGNLESRHGQKWPLSGGLWGTVPDRLARRTGGGLESIRRSIRVGRIADSEVVGRISTGMMGIHERGGTISAKGGWLAIPMRAALDGRGVLRASPRSFSHTFVARTRKGNLMVFRREGVDRIVPLFLLKKQVTIPPRLRLKETVNLEFGYFASKAVQRVAKEFDL